MYVYRDLSVLCQYQRRRPREGCVGLASGEDLGVVEVSGVVGSVSASGGGAEVGGGRLQPTSGVSF